MGYCNPASTTVAGPTIRLDSLRGYFASGAHGARRATALTIGNSRKAGRIGTLTGWVGVDPKKIVLGLPFFGYNFHCADAAVARFPSNGVSAPAVPCFGTRPLILKLSLEILLDSH